MRTEFAAEHLRCPVCRSERSLTLGADSSDAREVREGRLHCHSCGSEFPVRRGVAELLHEPPEHLLREAAGLERFAEYMRSHGWTREMILQLPEGGDGYWYTQSCSMLQLIHTLPFRAGESLVDVGSNTCWASNRFAELGLDVVALDIATTEMQGLYTADYFLDAGRSYFERVLGTMNDMPFASESFDYVYCCEVLHHNDPEGLRRTFAEAHRLLKPGGKLLVVNETLKSLLDPVGVHTDAVARFEGYEHAYWAWRYRWEAIRAGFATRVLEPMYWWPFNAKDFEPPPRASSLERVAKQIGFRLATSRPGRRAYTMWLNHVAGTVQLTMIATKRARRR
jgi:SAM-dependent methyltransferase